MSDTARIVISCPVCEAKDFDVTYEPVVADTDPAKLYGLPTGVRGVQRMVTCRRCGLLYENPRYPAHVIVRAYMASEDTGHDSQYSLRVRSFSNVLRKLRSRLPPAGAKVLDVGTASGAFLEAATKFGYDAWGLEPSTLRVSMGKERGLQIEQGVIENHRFPDGTFDMVTLWDVIEHMPDPRDALRRVHKLLKPGGMLLLNFPDIDTWQARLAGRHFWWILSAHLVQFSPSTITEICRRTGFAAFHFQPYWQLLEFGHLERVANASYKIPFGELAEKLTPEFIKRISVPYYASQTTALARRL